MISKTCEQCGKVIEGYTPHQVNHLLEQHKLVHRLKKEKIVEEVKPQPDIEVKEE